MFEDADSYDAYCALCEPFEARGEVPEPTQAEGQKETGSRPLVVRLLRRGGFWPRAARTRK